MIESEKKIGKSLREESKSFLIGVIYYNSMVGRR